MHIILFDGECNVCDSSVQFILKRDQEGMFSFASLQSEAGKYLREKYNIPNDTDSMVLVKENNDVKIKSNAVLDICRKLPLPWKLLYGLTIVPNSIRNKAYDWFANNRFKWFGKKQQCKLPTPEERQRFIESVEDI
ncbi:MULTISPECIES: thiol-disulfide oxidoreductase DCC family protein [Oceanobacillus]|uniref:Thiol-disulfide oxidoreductase n=1 Tax=Oceanobacillus kimchii TaxID=746691 RepID=A0ABQ5TMG9_9BACI|nr:MULTISPECIES: thiol-disulfide oxidoreductase DCC family protein [Oceanobacillus]MBT2600722.1 thiol-disulfide oxidoreductase DCC family protein [Oceanobacillus sp. ISL-74]MBT2650881.1 thiol-disulfide oxidoreductase DCC family protein [Oceanobacillus sp. ISL-73]MCT1575477.1 thiol-disulfide oxidoreductase DCC family protein [Oceanobacillus kimchii]MCT2138050.1 thiol-disulfide oxidoreductase DCC family protein [Oceanobacillus kimchii]OEH55294.1 thiol-disulfide oxidoreductase [Oceanobacillus sp.